MTAQVPIRHMIDTGAVRICCHEWGAQHLGAAPTMVLTHATGFHGRCWDRVIAQLGPRHVVAVDLRGHGHSEAHPFDDWRDLADDLVAVLADLGIEAALGIGHSVGGSVTLLAANKSLSCFARLILIDPVLMPPEFYEQRVNPMAAPEGQMHPVARRKPEFDSLQDMQTLLSARPPYALFDHSVMEDYCRHGTETVDGKQRLRCTPEFEASIYQSLLAYPDIPATIREVPQPTLVVRTQQPRRPEDFRDFRFSPTDPGLADRLPNGRDLLLPQFTHFLPQQAPEFCAGIILAGENAF